MSDEFVVRRRRVVVPQIDADRFGETPQRGVGYRTGDENAAMTGFWSWHLQSRFK
jgi:hypothetical protein